MENKLKVSNKGITLIALVITIIVLLILAGVSIAMLTGDNGILTQATGAKKENIKGQEKEQILLAMQSIRIEKERKNLPVRVSTEELQNQLIYDGAKNVIVETGENDNLEVDYLDTRNSYIVDQNGNIEESKIGEEGPVEQPENVAKSWEVTRKTDINWYSYNDISSGDKKVMVNIPKLSGNMKPIKYVGAEADTQTGSKWANAMTTDGSMWVWIPRYAYKITEGYHTNQAGTIEVAFIDTNNRFLNGEYGEITMNVQELGAGKTKWLVHPAFTANAETGGGFGELPGIWVGKFEATGTYSSGNASRVSVKPGLKSLRNMAINDQYKAGKNATYGESTNLNSHMAKNSEWGATVYLAHSKYGINKQKAEKNSNTSFFTGDTNIVENIYTINKRQSTTYNATGVYDLNGGSWEYVASYINSGDKNLEINGGTTAGDIYGATIEEQSTSTKYKTVYSSQNDQSKDYEMAGKKNKGDAVYETSATYDSLTGSWFETANEFPRNASPFFYRGGHRRKWIFRNIFISKLWKLYWNTSL
ncbi:MAG: Tfp pilus assembly protein FimT/FimU [Clostridia bacterium]